jgi:hypothetical protein
MAIGLAILSLAKIRTAAHVSLPPIIIQHIIYLGKGATNDPTRIYSP